MNAFRDTRTAVQVVTGRYLIWFAGRACGEERWRLEAGPDGVVVTGEQVLFDPHPTPSRQEYRATLTDRFRLTGLEIRWTVRDRLLVSTHHAEAERWRVRVEYDGQVKEQEGDYPDSCEVEYTTMLSNAFVLGRRDFQLGGEHEFPVLRIGPPWMAVSPDRMLVRCVEKGEFETPFGKVRASRYVLSLPPRGEEEGYSFWADEDGFVLESYEGLDLTRPWMRLIELTRE